jgi:hypothetical protein
MDTEISVHVNTSHQAIEFTRKARSLSTIGILSYEFVLPEALEDSLAKGLRQLLFGKGFKNLGI